MLAEAEPQQRRRFPTSSFMFEFDTPDTSTLGGNLSGMVAYCCDSHELQIPACQSTWVQFVGNDPALATLPGTGVGQNLVSLAPCAVNQPHVHPRGTEISHITKGTGMGQWRCLPCQLALQNQSQCSCVMISRFNNWLVICLHCNKAHALQQRTLQSAEPIFVAPAQDPTAVHHGHANSSMVTAFRRADVWVC